MALTIGQMADQIRAALIEAGPDARVECECGYGMTNCTLEATIEHAMFDHVTRRALLVVRTAPLLSGYQVGQMLGLSTQTAHEESWREQNPITIH